MEPYDPGMLLAIDIGNTNISVGRFDGLRLLGSRHAATNSGASADALEAMLDGLLRLDALTLADCAAITCASVVPALTERLAEVAARRETPLVVASANTVPIPVRVDRPGEVGADRLVNALAAARRYGTPAVVADFGTATTVDAVGADGGFIGGAIAPGLQLGLDALAEGTAQLPRVELRTPDRAIGRDTVSAIQAGAVFGYQALASGLIERVRAELAEISEVPADHISVILTGGLSAAPWAAAIPGVRAIDPDLTLHGLAILHAEFAGSRA